MWNLGFRFLRLLRLFGIVLLERFTVRFSVYCGFGFRVQD